MKSIAVSCVAAAALSLSLVAPVLGSSPHDAQLAAHRRRFHHHQQQPGPRSADTDESADSAVVDVDLAAPGELLVRNASPVEPAAVGRSGDAPPQTTEAPTAKHLMKRDYNGRATFFEPGLGACGGYSSAGDFVRNAPHTHLSFLAATAMLTDSSTPLA